MKLVEVTHLYEAYQSLRISAGNTRVREFLEVFCTAPYGRLSLTPSSPALIAILLLDVT